ncbi:MAG: LysM peptidoglycan-binding domain-containing M23 family metallopeptidase [Leptospiraceae bacterium]|nr:LysM peptidoglycan-binding domain-containing M23 family metallopeptidase [Leptospiraceae bacterium]
MYNSSSSNKVVDRNTVNPLIFLILISIFPGMIFANPFEKYNEELNQFAPLESSNFFRTSDNSISHLFKSGKFVPNTDSEEDNTMDELPKYLNFSTLVSSKIVREKGEIIKSHTVKPKDTLLAISKQYKSDINKIKKKNGLKTDLIRTGEVLEIPVVTGNASVKKVVTQRIFINPVPDSRITSRFGRRSDPFNKYSRNFHSGLDMAAKVGTPVVASSDGEVVFTGNNGGYGNTVILLHANGYKTVYAHCAKIVVEVGEKVKMGRVIAAVGRTGTATGAHLHFEVFKNGKLINPQTALNSYEKVITKLTSSEVAGL